MKKISITQWVLGGLSALALSAQAQTFTYNNGDLLIGLRNESGGTKDLVINAGPVTGFTNRDGGSIPITALSVAKLNAAFGGYSGLAWSASACYDVFAPVSVQDTIYMTSPRSDYNTQSTPWVPDSASAQDYVVAKINSVGKGAAAIGAALAANAITNSPTSLIENESWNVAPKFSYFNMVKTKPQVADPNTGLIFANWLGTFQGNPEQYSDALPARADFYQLPPGAASATYLGFFEFAADGSMTFNSASSIIQSHITQITRVGTTTTVYFTTGSGGTYTLKASDNLTTPRASWTTVSSVSGNGAVQSLPETTTSAARYYLISAQ